MSKVILVTGGQANQGLGYEFVKQLAEHGHTVYLGARDIDKGNDAVSKIGLDNVHALKIEVTNGDSVNESVQSFKTKESHLDMLINNAGIAGRKNNGCDVGEMQDIFNTNVFGVARVTNAYLDLLKKSEKPTIWNIGSMIGAIGLITNVNAPAREWLPYSASKTAMHVYTIMLSQQHPDIKINVVNPGYCGTNLNEFAGTMKPCESVKSIVDELILSDNTETGKFYTFTGEEISW
ncbi:(+)-neomenthol dehydrogenase [Acrasis kona]|uniref:(+)-neomenthol dehydrogenase n=1 Tax=Acrasis kona TaxID=1008807 RepID=A0AAW2ZI44_9EUKA